MFDVIVLGGGAAGFFCAIHISEHNPALKVAILEKSMNTLAKVKISGGGRCNVAHAHFEPSALVSNYPRGEKELLGPFHVFSTGNTIDFFEKRGIQIKTESDGRMFPASNSSQTIIDCFEKEIEVKGIALIKETPVNEIEPIYMGQKKSIHKWKLKTTKQSYECSKLVICTGSSPKVWRMLETLGHSIIPPVPSLFTFNIKDKIIEGIPGVSTEAEVQLRIESNLKGNNRRKSKSFISKGPTLITHWGLSGPGILKLSAWAARELNACDYKFQIRVNWLPDERITDVLDRLNQLRKEEAKRTVHKTKVFDLPSRLWRNLVQSANINSEDKWADVPKSKMELLSKRLCASEFRVNGKSTFKEEFVTAGGIDLKEVNFKTFESKIFPSLYFAGEVLNIDAITGGFNFQNAWTGAYIAAKAITTSVD